jgi:hypothetical protein
VLKDQVRVLEKQAESLRQLKRIEGERNKMLDRKIRIGLSKQAAYKQPSFINPRLVSSAC